MISKLLVSALAFFLLISPIYSQEPAVPIASASSVQGLELPADQNVSFDEGFVNLQAKCKGEVKWLVVAGVKVKYVTVPQSNSIILSIPPQGGVISVFAVALVDGKLTDFARTNITVAGGNPCPPSPNPNPGPPTPIPTGAKLHVTLILDTNNPTPERAALINSKNLRDGITQRGHWFRAYDVKSPVIAQKKLDQVVQKVGGDVLVVQSDDGRVLVAQPLPKAEQEIISIVIQQEGK